MARDPARGVGRLASHGAGAVMPARVLAIAIAMTVAGCITARRALPEYGA
jgi:hypothetical protein